MLGLKGDFTGFTFNGVHSSELGITHVSDGDRYKDSLVPEIEDKTVEIPGLDGVYFYGSNFKTRSIPLSIAFDEVTEDQIREMRQLFGYRHTGELIFDEMPYKKYLVKVASPPELEYVCFDERRKIASENAEEGIRTIRNLSETVTIPALEDEVTLYEYSLHEQPIQKPVAIVNGEEIEYTYNINTNKCIFEKGEEEIIVTLVYDTKEKIYPYELSNGLERIYKGEGSIEFIAYYPFAKMVTKFADEYIDDNKNEWLNVSGLKDSTWFDSEDVDEYVDSAGAINVYNPGDIETGFKLFIPFDANGTIPTFTLTYKDQVLNISEITRKEEDVIVNGITEPGSVGVQINTDNGLIEGIWKRTENASEVNDIFVTSGQIYNECATGEFFKIQPSNQIQEIGITIDPGDMEIYYDYLYF